MKYEKTITRSEKAEICEKQLERGTYKGTIIPTMYGNITMEFKKYIEDKRNRS